jgi:recombination protein RecA
MSKKKKSDTSDEKVKTLDSLIAGINKRYGTGTILRADDAIGLVIDRVPLGVFELDLRLGGGIPRGRITMLKGDYSTGKSALCLKAAAAFQRCDRFTGKPYVNITTDGEVIDLDFGREGKPEPMRVVWLDSEHSWDNSWSKLWGIDTGSLYLIQTEYMEQAIDIADACVRSGECDLLVVDSIAALTPSVEIEESAEKLQMGVSARLMNKALRKWTSGLNSGGLLAETKCTILLVNQFRLAIGGGFSYKTSPGGKGLDYSQSIEVQFKHAGWVTEKKSDRSVGSEIEFTITKNKTAPAAGKGKFKMFFVTSEELCHYVGETDVEAQVLRSAVYWGLISKGGAGWFTLGDNKVQGELSASMYLRDNPEYFKHLQETILKNELAWMKTGKRHNVNEAKTAEVQS